MTPARRQRLRQLLWIYFWLLILEGALRKWILPGLSNSLLLVRDPVALLALWWGYPLLRQRPWRSWLLPVLAIGLLAFLLAITVGHGDIFVAAFGARVLVLQLPLIFLYGALFDRSDVIRFAWFLAWLSIPMTLLIVAQSSLPSSHILNVAPGGEGTAVFAGALDRFRPPGTFSFINGVSSFYTLAASGLFLLLYGTRLRPWGRLLCLLVGVALVVALPVSISRSLLAGYLQVLAAVIVALALSRSRLVPLLSGLLAMVVAVGIATTIPAFQGTSEAFMTRWDNAAGSESRGDERFGGAVGVFQTRVLSGFTSPLSQLEAVPLLGYGIGIGTNVGAQRLTGQRGFVVGEDAWEASLSELGALLGPAFLVWRVVLGLWLLRLSVLAALRANPLPLIMAGSSLLGVISGQLSQPTGLGFIVVSAGLTLAACKCSAPRPGFRIQLPQPPQAASLVPLG
jgi:hypothetical protein